MTEAKYSRWWAIAVGAGLGLSPIHNMRLTQWATNDAGETLFFLPAFGYLVWIVGTGLFLLYYWDKVKEIGWGDRRITISLLIIVGAIALSGITADGWQAKFAPLGAGVALFGLYVMARVVGRDLFLPLAIGAGVASLGVIAHQIVYPGVITGGFVFEDNYDIVVGYVLLGVALWIHKWQWILAGLALVAILLTGSPEGVFALGVVGIAVLARRDWGRKLAIVLAPVVIVAVVGLVSGYGQTLYSYAVKIASGEPTNPYAIEDSAIHAVGYRLDVIIDAMTHIKPLGEGYNLTDFSRSPNVHNVPLVLVQQLGYPGILAAIAWLWVSIYCLVKTRWRYAWIALLSVSVWDHYMWSQLGVVYWVLVGASTAPDNIRSDLLFKEG